MHLYYHNHLSVPTDDLSTDCAWWYSAQGAWGALAGHNNEVNPTRSTSPSHALFGVTLPCPGKCWACKTELSIIQHEQEDVWSDMGGGQGPTKPRADRGYHFDVSVWACRVEQGAVGNLLEHPAPPPPPPPPTPPPPLLRFPFPSLPMLILCAPFMSCFIFPSDTHTPSPAPSLLHTYINKPTHTHTHARTVHAHWHESTLSLSVNQTRAGSTCYR